MSNFLSFFVPGIPIPQGSMRTFNGRVVASNSSPLKKWRKQIQQQISLPSGWDDRGAYHLRCAFLFMRPKSHMRKNGLAKSAPEHIVTRPDLDKLVRAVGDALTDSGAIADDSRIVMITAVKAYESKPGVKVLLERM